MAQAIGITTLATVLVALLMGFPLWVVLLVVRMTQAVQWTLWGSL